MRWWVLGVAIASLVAGCDRKRTVGSPRAGDGATAADAGGTEAPALSEVTVIDWEFETVTRPEVDPPRVRVLLTKTVETGAREPVVIGTYEGTCSAWNPLAREPDPHVRSAFTGFECFHAGAGIRVRAVRQGGQLILVQTPLDEMTSEPAYEEMMRVPVRAGAVVRAR